jgi:hypothetical protein
LNHLTQPVEVEHVCGLRQRLGCVEGDGRVAAVGQADDDIRALTVTETDERQ